MNKFALIIIITISSAYFSCNNSETASSSNKKTMTPDDTCKSGELYSYLYLDFRDNMTNKQFNETRTELIKQGKIDSDSTIKMYIPNAYGDPIEVKFFICSIIENSGDCFMHRVWLDSRFGNLNSEPKAGILDLFQTKYGEPDKLGYTNIVLDNGEIIDGFYGLEYALEQMKPGQSFSQIQRIENNKEQGSGVWKTKELVISVTYTRFDISIEYRSLKYIRDKQALESNKRTTKDSLNKIKISK